MLRRTATVLAAAGLLASVCATAQAVAVPAKTIFVYAAGDDTNPNCGISANSACKTITNALTKADPGDTIAVGTGTYAESVSIGSAVTLTNDAGTTPTVSGTIDIGGSAGPVTVSGLIVSGGSLPAITVHDSTADSPVTITGNTIDGDVSGVDVTGPNSVTITDNAFAIGTGGGAAIALSAATPDALAATLAGNTGTVAAPTNTITESGDGTITIATTGSANTITPAPAPTFAVGFPLSVTTLEDPSAVTVSSDLGGVPPGSVTRFDLALTGTTDMSASDLTLSLDGSPLALSGTASSGNGITGSFTSFPSAASVAASGGTGALALAITLDDIWNGQPVNTLASSTGSTTIVANQQPVAADQSVSVVAGASQDITLGPAADADGDAVTYGVGTPTGGGSVTVSGTVAHYTAPATAGDDSFTFTADDGLTTATTGTVSVTVAAANHPPVAGGQSLSVVSGHSVAITLGATDADNDALTYAIGTQPTLGELGPPDGTQISYTAGSATGSDSFTFTVDDGHGGTDTGTISIAIAANHQPVAADQSVSVVAGASLDITLGPATDADGDAVTYGVGTPTGGSVVVNGTSAHYTAPATAGSDSFTFTASDGLTTGTGTVTIAVTAPNHPPVAAAHSVKVATKHLAVVDLGPVADVDGDPVTYRIATGPSHGAATVSGHSVAYTTSLTAPGTDSFTYTANDGKGGQATGTVSVTITANARPVVNDQSLSDAFGAKKAIALGAATDADRDPVLYSVTTPARHGAVLVSGRTATYQPAKGFAGTDSFVVTGDDGLGGVDSGTITVRVGKAVPVITRVTFSPSNPTSAQVPKATVYVSGGGGSVTGGTVSVTYGSATHAAKVSGGRAVVTLTRLSGGKRTFTFHFGGTTTTSTAKKTAYLTVRKVATTLTFSTSPAQLTTKSRGKALVRVSAPGATVSGALVTIKSGSHVVGTGRVSKGVATVSLPMLAIGQHNWTVVFSGTASAAAATKSVVVRVALG